MGKDKEIVIIYDGECEFCRSSLAWLEKKMQVTALPFQSADLGTYGLTQEQCLEQVYVICNEESYAGAAALSFLLRARGNTLLSGLITLSGGVGRYGYRWVASNRDSFVVKILSRTLQGRWR